MFSWGEYLIMWTRKLIDLKKEICLRIKELQFIEKKIKIKDYSNTFTKYSCHVRLNNNI